MSKEILFDQEINKLIVTNVPILQYEYSQVDEKTWNEFATKPNCACRGKIFKLFQDDPKKFNEIVSKLMGEEVAILFPGPIEDPIVKEFKTLKGMEEYLKELKSKGKMIRSASPAPNGSGGYLLVVM